MITNLKQVAIVLLAYADFEALEIALANFSKHIENGAKLFILQNGRDTYDCERTYRVAKRYANLYPMDIQVVDWIKPQKPYFAIKELLNNNVMNEFDYICKVDDDVFPLRSDWLNKMIDCYNQIENQYDEQLGYVTGLVNNNPWGFNEILDIFDLKNEYFNNYARTHRVGGLGDEVSKIESSDKIYTGCCGTIWSNSYISRWIHEKTSFYPENYIRLTEKLGYKEIENTKRYSINVMLFKKDFWNLIDNGGVDDEHMTLVYCKNNNKKIIADLSNPFVHICFFTQREENRDLLPKFREIYTKWLNLPYPISMCPLKEYENENRLRYIEMQIQNNKKIERNINSKNFIQKIFSVKNKNKTQKIITILGVEIPINRKLKQSKKLAVVERERERERECRERERGSPICQ